MLKFVYDCLELDKKTDTFPIHFVATMCESKSGDLREKIQQCFMNRFESSKKHESPFYLHETTKADNGLLGRVDEWLKENART